jgi:chromosome segregation ATPase
MREFMAGLLSAQDLTETPREGLPYWIFWLLLLVILLLLTFIFLRDKDLRRRLDSFFSRLRNRMIILRLQSILKKENQKREQFTIELGREARDKNIPVSGGEQINEQLGALENKVADLSRRKAEQEESIASLQRELEDYRAAQEKRLQEILSEKTPFQQTIDRIRSEENGIATEVTRLHSQRETAVRQLNHARKDPASAGEKSAAGPAAPSSGETGSPDPIGPLQTQVKDLDAEINRLVSGKAELEQAAEKNQAQIEAIDKKIKALNEETRNESRSLQKDIKEKQKNLTKTRDRIQSLETEKIPLFLSLGQLVDEKRDSLDNLTHLYSKIDRTQRRIAEIEKQIQALE